MMNPTVIFFFSLSQRSAILSSGKTSPDRCQIEKLEDSLLLQANHDSNLKDGVDFFMGEFKRFPEKEGNNHRL